jgi:hypothetical protein
LKARWLARKSAKKHLDSEDHARHCDVIRERRQLEEEERRKQEIVYTSSYVIIDPTIPNPVPSQRPQMSGFEDPDVFLDTECLEPIIPTYIEPIIHDPALEKERLRQQVELLMLQAQQCDEFGDDMFEDDATVTNVSGPLGASKGFSFTVKIYGLLSLT